MNVATTIRIILAAAGAAALAACSSSGERSPPAFSIVSPPVVSAAGTAGLAYRLELSTTLNADITAELDDGQGHAFSVFIDSPSEFNNDSRVDHDLTLLGLRPDRSYRMTVSAVTADGLSATAAGELEIVTSGLPADFPRITVNTSLPDRMEPGYTLLDTRRKDGSAAYIVILDQDGEVVWYFQPDGASSTTAGASGFLLTIDETIGLIREIDMRGEQQDAFHASQTDLAVGDSIGVDTTRFHDDVVFDTGRRTYFTSFGETRQIDGFPLDESDPGVTGTADVADEPIVEFAENGTIIGTWNFLDLLQPTRIGFDGTDGLPDLPADWAHVNAVIYDRGSDSIVVSLRHQDAVVSFSRETSELRWIAGTPANWSADFDPFLLDPDGETDWFYHQHATEISGTSTILLFDNGNRRASPFTGAPITPADANFSRAVEYSIDETAMEITKVWEWGIAQGAPGPLYSPFAGDADRLGGTGNTLVTFGAICELGGIPSDDFENCETRARIFEVEADTDEIVFDVAVDGETGSAGYIVWRAERIANIYVDGTGTIIPASD